MLTLNLIPSVTNVADDGHPPIVLGVVLRVPLSDHVSLPWYPHGLERTKSERGGGGRVMAAVMIRIQRGGRILSES